MRITDKLIVLWDVAVILLADLIYCFREIISLI